MIILASASPRRREILSRIVRCFDVIVPGCSEEVETSVPSEIVAALAERKAMAVARSHPCDIVLGSDTIVTDMHGVILGKPKDKSDARRMIKLLEGRSHTVWTGVCLIVPGKDPVKEAEGYEVWFAPMSEEEIEAYIAAGDWEGKAGAYAVQGEAGKFIEKISGSYTGIMGLPVHRTYALLREAGALEN